MFLSRASLARTVFLMLTASLSMTMVGAMPAAPSAAPALNQDASAGADWAAFSTSMETMHRSMGGVRPSEDSDLNFVNLMLPHHEAAIDMAKIQLKYGNDPQMRRLAQEIITDQQSEIELMRLWLKQHHSSVLNPETK